MQNEKASDTGGPAITSRPAITTLGKLGAQLPCGMLDQTSGELQKAMQARVWNLRREKNVGRFRDENRKASVGQFVSAIVALLYAELGALHFEDQPTPGGQDLVAISSMLLGDVLYAYFWLRRECLGSEVDVKTRCTECGSANQLTADLDSLEVRTVERIEQSRWSYELRNPFEIRGKLVEAFEMAQPRWGVMRTVGGAAGGMNIGAVKAEMIRHSIHGIVGQPPIAIAEPELDEMSKRDVEALSAEIDSRLVGPVVTVEHNCTSCRGDYIAPIDWTYDSFFSTSGRSVP